MIVVVGKLYVEPEARADYLAGCTEVMVQARDSPGRHDFQLTADPLEPGRSNVFEQWESAEDVEAFRGSGPAEDQQASVVSAEVYQHEVASSMRL